MKKKAVKKSKPIKKVTVPKKQTNKTGTSKVTKKVQKAGKASKPVKAPSKLVKAPAKKASK